MLVPALVLIAASLTVGAAGVLARYHRLPRNRVLGIRTMWTMSSVDAFRRANRVAAPSFVAAGAVGTVAGTVTLLSPSTATALTVLIVGVLGLLVLTAIAGVVGSRFAELDEAEVRSGPLPGSCTAGAPSEPDDSRADDREGCGPAPGACAGACSICPRATS